MLIRCPLLTPCFIRVWNEQTGQLGCRETSQPHRLFCVGSYSRRWKGLEKVRARSTHEAIMHVDSTCAFIRYDTSSFQTVDEINAAGLSAGTAGHNPDALAAASVVDCVSVVEATAAELPRARLRWSMTPHLEMGCGCWHNLRRLMNQHYMVPSSPEGADGCASARCCSLCVRRRTVGRLIRSLWLSLPMVSHSSEPRHCRRGQVGCAYDDFSAGVS